MTPVPFTFDDGASSTARLFEAGATAVLVAPAMGVNARAYDRLGEGLAQRGLTTLVAELRGGDSSSVRARRGVDYGYPELLRDVLQHVAWLRARYQTVHVFGHSLGGHLLTLSAPGWCAPGSKYVVIGSGTVHFRAWEGLERWKLLVQTQLAGAVNEALGYFPGHRLGFGGRQGQSLIRAWARCARTGSWGALEAGLSAVAPQVRALHVIGDTWAPRASTEALVGKLPAAQVTWRDVAPPVEPSAMNPHFRWMKEPSAVVEETAAFLTG